MGKLAEAIEILPYVMYAAGGLCIIADGPLPFGDILGGALIAYGRGLQVSLKVGEAILYIDDKLTGQNQVDNVGYWTGPGIKYYYGQD